jgi:hypothetical protein
MDGSTTSITYENVAAELLRHIPEFAGVYQEHLNDCGELVPSVLFGNLFDFTVDVWHSRQRSGRWTRDPRAVLLSVVDFLEEVAHSKDKLVIDLLLTGFLENLNPNDSDHQSIAGLLRFESQKLLQLSRT